MGAVNDAVKEVVEHPLGKAAALAIDVMFPGLPVGTALATVAEMTGKALDQLTDEDIDEFQRERLLEQRAAPEGGDLPKTRAKVK